MTQASLAITKPLMGETVPFRLFVWTCPEDPLGFARMYRTLATCSAGACARRNDEEPCDAATRAGVNEWFASLERMLGFARTK